MSILQGDESLKRLFHGEFDNNGSWVNPADRWMEGDPNLTTAYSLMALKYCDPK